MIISKKKGESNDEHYSKWRDSRTGNEFLISQAYILKDDRRGEMEI